MEAGGPSRPVYREDRGADLLRQLGIRQDEGRSGDVVVAQEAEDVAPRGEVEVAELAVEVS